MTEHFSDDELRCKCGCGRQEMEAEFLVTLEAIRIAYNRPMHLSSAFRCPAHNAAVSHTGTSGPHTTGRAVDVLVSGRDAHDLICAAVEAGITGIGVSQKGPHAQRFIHLDDLEGPTRPWVWSY